MNPAIIASCLNVNDISPTGCCKLVVSYMIGIDKPSYEESISRGCTLVALPSLVAVPDWGLGCLTFPAAPQRASTAEHRE